MKIVLHEWLKDSFCCENSSVMMLESSWQKPPCSTGEKTAEDKCVTLTPRLASERDGLYPEGL